MSLYSKFAIALVLGKEHTMSNYFGTRRVSREELRHAAHGQLVQVCAKYIAAEKNKEKREILTEALTMYMSIKVGDTKREDIVAAYEAAVAEAIGS
jgi:hypothetical protein